MKKLILFFILSLVFSKSFSQCGASFLINLDQSNPYGVVVTDMSVVNSSVSTTLIDYGDGTPVMGTMTHIYSAPGNYTICYSITDNFGCQSTTCQTIAVPFNSGIFIREFADSSGSACSVPWTKSLGYSGKTSGNTINDSINIHVYFGDGTDSLFMQVANGVNFYGNLHHVYANPGTFFPWMIVSNSGNTDTAYCNTVLVSSTCGTITGYAYNDINQDCIFDSSDITSVGFNVQLFNNGLFITSTITDYTGFYSFYVPTGNNYEVHVYPNNFFNAHLFNTCPSSGSMTVSSPSSSNNFAMECAAGFDFTGGVFTNSIVPGVTGSLNVYAKNTYCFSTSGQIEVTLPSDLIPLADSSYTINGNVVTYQLDSSSLYWNFIIHVSASSSLIIGDTVCVSFNILPVIGDSVPSNNSGDFCFPVRSSYDPNTKSVQPPGETSLGLINSSQDLVYTIQFQNTGTADALNIVITDTISQYLDILTVEILGASHLMNWFRVPGNIIKFYFDNINLPDSTSDEPNSHGNISYRIHQLPNNPTGTIITNSADIFFDYNVPVHTNQTSNMIDNTVSIRECENCYNAFSIYPTLADDIIAINFPSSAKREICIYNYLGKNVFYKSVASKSIAIDIHHLPSGNYIVKSSDALHPVKLVVLH